jgi:hypothetical protein
VAIRSLVSVNILYAAIFLKFAGMPDSVTLFTQNVLGFEMRTYDGARVRRIEFRQSGWLREITSETIKPATLQKPSEPYLKLGFGGAQTDSNQRLMYTSA